MDRNEKAQLNLSKRKPGREILREELEDIARKEGADLFGIAGLKEIEGVKTEPPELLDSFETAISIAVRLNDYVLDSIENEPTPQYAHQYEMANRTLDRIAFKIQNRLQNSGYKSLAIAASQVIDRENWRGYISHKVIGRAAGLGWLGKSLLLVNPDYGPRVRLASILTDLNLETDEPISNKCGNCTSCVDACPADAIKNSDWEDRPNSREETLHLERCASLLVEDFSKREGIGHSICGVCVKVCPYGQ